MVKDDVIYINCNKLFVPHKLRLKVLTICHGVHHDVNQTICRIKNWFFWPGLRDSVQTFIQSCRTCSLVKPKFVPSSSSPILCKAPLEIRALDFVGPLPLSYGNRYLLVAVDLLSHLKTY